ncbi:MAG: L,D-transpeptidase [Nitrospira sp.]|nr:L,D-transpeptidase [Nitrospira sp.]
MTGWASEDRSPCAIHYPSDQRIAWQCRRLQRGESLERLFGPQWIDVARFNRIDRRHAVPGREIKIPLHIDEVAEFTPLRSTYPAAVRDEKLILIDLTEQFLGAYEQGQLRFSFPIASGGPENATPVGEFRVSAAHRTHRSCLYTIEHTESPYPMHYALRFHINKEGVSYWIHGRDLPGFPASHGCIGLSDEQMQVAYYGTPTLPILEDAKTLYDWVLEGMSDVERLQDLADGPRVIIQGVAPVSHR